MARVRPLQAARLVQACGRLIAALLAAGTAQAQELPPPPEWNDVREDVVARATFADGPAIAVAVVVEGKLVWAEGFGIADRATGRRATADTAFRLASISKPITATLLMQLVEEGKLDLDEPATKFFPGRRIVAYRGRTEDITLRRLANHTAGLPTHWHFFFDSVPPTRDLAIDAFAFAATPPGARTNYSNFAFGLLEEVVARTRGTTFRDVAREHLFVPLGMMHSDVGRPRDPAVECAEGYAKAGSQSVGNYGFDHDGASAIWCSARDLAAFASLHLQRRDADNLDRVLDERSAIVMSRPEASDAGSKFGVGWAVDRPRGLRRLTHTGGMPGVATSLAVYPDWRAAAVVLTNASGHTHTAAVMTAIESRLLDGAPQRRAPATEPLARTELAALPEGPLALRGTLRTPAGPIPMRLTRDDAGAVRAWIDGREVQGNGAAVAKDGVWTWNASAQIRIPTRELTADRLTFELAADNDQPGLRGVLYAERAGVCRVPLWCELQPERTRTDGTLRVVSYNVLVGWRDSEVGRFLPGEQRLARAAAFLAATQPDVIAFQELNGFDEPRLRALAAAWGHEHATMLKTDGYPIGITSRLPIEVLGKHRDGLHHGMLHVRTHDTEFVVVHLKPQPDLAYKRRELATALACAQPALAAGRDVIVLGDFNSIEPADAPRWNDEARDYYRRWRYAAQDDRPTEYALPVLLEAGFVDVTAPHLPPTLVMPRIDFVLASPSLAARCTAAEWRMLPAERTWSDHPPVVVDFERR